MRTITKNLYSFMELSEEAKQKAITNNREINVDFDDWWNEEGVKDFLKSFGFEATGIVFDLSCCQGSGASFDGFPILEKLLTKEEIDLVDKADASFFITRKVEFSFTNDITEEKYNDLDTICSKLEQKRLDACDELYKSLDALYEYLTSDESVSETLIANEYEFEDDGSIA